MFKMTITLYSSQPLSGRRNILKRRTPFFLANELNVIFDSYSLDFGDWLVQIMVYKLKSCILSLFYIISILNNLITKMYFRLYICFKKLNAHTLILLSSLSETI